MENAAPSTTSPILIGAETPDVIATERLELVAMTPAFLDATRHGLSPVAEALLGMPIPADWFTQKGLAELRLGQLAAGITGPAWLPRAIRWRETGEMVGHIGFHTTPGPEYLKSLAPQGVELGYTVFAAHRRQGIALEASRGLMAWATREHGVRSFIASVGTQNIASLAMVTKLGFRRIGSHVDEEDGVEHIFELRVAPRALTSEKTPA